jgi:translation elongation factor EF-Tu-like GTPase
MPNSEGKLIGRVSHYFGNISVAVIELKDSLEIGENIRIVGGENDFTQTVTSMEVNHQQVKKAKKGESVGIKVVQKVREGYRVYKV